MHTVEDFMNVEAIEAKAKSAFINEVYKEIAELSSERSAVLVKRDEATAAGNLDEYERLDSRFKALSARIDFLFKKKAKSLYTADEVKAAWADYAQDYNADISGLMAAYEDGRRELAKLYVKILRKQAQAIPKRDKMASLIRKVTGGPEPLGFANPNHSLPAGMAELYILPDDNRAMCKLTGGGPTVPIDAAFFAQDGTMDDTTLLKIRDITNGVYANI